MISSPILAAPTPSPATSQVPEIPLTEAIVSVFAADSSLAGLISAGATPVLADVDPETGGMSRTCVEAQIGIDTKSVLVEPDHGSYANWEGVQLAISDRSIALQIEGKGNVGEWQMIAPGLRAWGKHLVEVDERQIVGGPAAAIPVLRALGIVAQAYDTTMAFERPKALVRGKRRDYPGAVAWQNKMIVVENWESARQELQTMARELARQLSFDFSGDLVAKPVLSEGKAKHTVKHTAKKRTRKSA